MDTIERDSASGARTGERRVTDNSACQAPPGRRILVVLVGMTVGAIVAIYFVGRAGFF